MATPPKTPATASKKAVLQTPSGNVSVEPELAELFLSVAKKAKVKPAEVLRNNLIGWLFDNDELMTADEEKVFLKLMKG